MSQGIPKNNLRIYPFTLYHQKFRSHGSWAFAEVKEHRRGHGNNCPHWLPGLHSIICIFTSLCSHCGTIQKCWCRTHESHLKHPSTHIVHLLLLQLVFHHWDSSLIYLGPVLRFPNSLHWSGGWYQRQRTCVSLTHKVTLYPHSFRWHWNKQLMKQQLDKNTIK